MNKDTIKKRILQKLDWGAPKELYEWKPIIIILRECGYKNVTFCLKKNFQYIEAQLAFRDLTEETFGVSRIRMYLVPPLKKGVKQ